jgi:hypothetical protein
MKMKRLSLSCMALVLSSAALSATSSNDALRPTVSFNAPRIPRVTVNASNQSWDLFAKDLEAQSQTTILVEPGIRETVTGQFDQRPLDEVLTQLSGVQGPVWARVEITQKKDTPLPTDGLFDLVRALNALSSERMTVQLPDAKGPIAISKNATFTNAAVPQGSTLQTLYVIARRAKEVSAVRSLNANGLSGPTTENVNRYNELAQNRFSLMQQMSPEERQLSLQQDMQFMMNLPQQDRMQMMMDRRNAWRSMPDDVRQQFRQTMRQTWQQMGGGPRRWNRGGTPNTNPPPNP